LQRSDLDQTYGSPDELPLMFLEDLPDAALPKVPFDGPRIRFPGHHDPDHGLGFRRRLPDLAGLTSPQVKKASPNEISSFGEKLEGCLPADPLIRAEPFLWLQRLYLDQFFPALFPSAPKDFSSPGRPRTGKKAMLITTFSFGRLVSSFHGPNSYLISALRKLGQSQLPFW